MEDDGTSIYIYIYISTHFPPNRSSGILLCEALRTIETATEGASARRCGMVLILDRTGMTTTTIIDHPIFGL